jgi:hypothetical protein
MHQSGAFAVPRQPGIISLRRTEQFVSSGDLKQILKFLAVCGAVLNQMQNSGPGPGTACWERGDCEDVMSKTNEAVEHDNPTFFESGSQTHLTGRVLLYAMEIPDAENVRVIGPDQGFCFRIAVSERWDGAWMNSLDAGAS